MRRLVCLLGLVWPVLAQTVVLASTDPDIIYSPPLCTTTNCTSPWQVSNTTGIPVVYTNGPIAQAGDVIPQLFLSIRASSLSLSSTPLSNATVNFSLTAEPSDVSITSQVNTSISLIVAVDLPVNQTTTLGVTFIQGDLPSRFDIESITLSVPNASATASFLPSPSLPVSSSPPTLVPSPTPSNASVSDKRVMSRTVLVTALLLVLSCTHVV